MTAHRSSTASATLACAALASAALACAACGHGDGAQDDDPLAPISGTRLALQKYRYDDGTEHAVAGEFYDTQLHVQCRPGTWVDDVLRCVPVADDAVYVDPACTTLIGLGRTNPRPTYFVAHETRAAVGGPARLFRAGPRARPIAQYYAITDGACTGPTPVPVELLNYFEIGDELDGAALVAFHHDEIGEGRLGLWVRRTDDGVRIAAGLRDRDLDVACAPGYRSDGVVCEPAGAVPATLFRDPACSEPVVAVGSATQAPPTLARVIEPSGCASYHRIGRELSLPVYRREGASCTAVVAPAEGRLFSVDGALALPTLERSLEDLPDRRLRRVVLEHGGLRYLDGRMHDRETDLECRPRSLRDGIRCLPPSIPAATLFLDGCATVVRVAEVPQRACERVAFATTNRPFQLRAIGGLVTVPLSRIDNGNCVPYAIPPGMELRDLGPTIDIERFPGGVYFSERAQ
jgi:hypothetical protein